MKEKMKSILFVLALALVFVGATKVTMASAATEGDMYPAIEYAEELVKVKATSGSVYYQIVKKSTDTTVKAANWVPAADAGNNIYWIDFSGLSNTKDVYIAYAESNTATTATVITVPAKYKSVKASLKYETETVSGGIYDVIAKLDVKGVSKSDDFNTASDKLKDKDLRNLVILGWKRGANGKWKAAGEFDTVEWNMLKASNGTLYLRVEEADGDANGSMDKFRYTKEAKIKIPKTAKAPSIKIDYKKQTVALKSGMEFRLDGQNDWIKIAVKKNGEANTTDPFAANISKGVSSVTVEKLMNKLGVASGSTFTINVRTAATDKKFASRVTDVKIAAPVALTNVKTDAAAKVLDCKVVSGTTKVVAKLKLANAIEGIDATYEYAFVGSDYDPAQVKFTKASASEITLSKFKAKDSTVTYTNNTGNKKATVKYEDALLLIRKAADTKTKGSEKFASQIVVIDYTFEYGTAE